MPATWWSRDERLKRREVWRLDWLTGVCRRVREVASGHGSDLLFAVADADEAVFCHDADRRAVEVPVGKEASYIVLVFGFHDNEHAFL
jgi:hypothetical protein